MNTYLTVAAILLLLSIVLMIGQCRKKTNEETYECTQQLCTQRQAGNSVALDCIQSAPFGDQSCRIDGSTLTATCDDDNTRCSVCPAGYWIDPTAYDQAMNVCVDGMGEGGWFAFYDNDPSTGQVNYNCNDPDTGADNTYCKPPNILTPEEIFALAQSASPVRGTFPPGNYSQVGSGQMYLHTGLGVGVINESNSTVTFQTTNAIAGVWSIYTFQPNNDLLFLSRLVRPNRTAFFRLTSFAINTNPSSTR
jgi:hypothetical protein